MFAVVVVAGFAIGACDRDSPGFRSGRSGEMMIKPLPKTKDPLVLLTDFTNPAAWEVIRNIIRTPVDGFDAYVQFQDDQAYANVGVDKLKAAIGSDYRHGFIFLVDREALLREDHALLVVGLREYDPKPFRAAPNQVQAIQNNVSIGNIGLEEFADSLDPSDTFRGFRKPK